MKTLAAIRWLAGALFFFVAMAAQAATISFSGAAVAGCTLTAASKSYSCASIPYANWNDGVVVADGYTLNLTSSFNPGYNNPLTLSGSAALKVAGNLDLSDLNPASLATSAATLTATGTVKLNSSMTVNGSISANVVETGSSSTIRGTVSAVAKVVLASYTTVTGNIFTGVLDTGSPVTVTGNITATGDVKLSSGAVINGNVTGVNIDTGSPVTVVGNIDASGKVYLASGASITGNISCTELTSGNPVVIVGDVNASVSFKFAYADQLKGNLVSPSVTLDNAATVSGDVTAGHVWLDYHARVLQMIYCTGGDSANCGCVTNNSAYAINTALGPHCSAPTGGSSAASAFDCLETGANAPWSASARKPLYTKLAKTDFNFDIAALKADRTLEGNYVASGAAAKYLKVELFDETAGNCADTSKSVASQNVTFAAGSISGAAGRVLSGNFNLSAAYPKLACRVRECSTSACTSFTGVTGCSTDNFAVRPTGVTLVTNATAAAPSASDPITFKAGANFNLSATTPGVASSGTLTLNTAKLTVPSGRAGALSPATLTANAASTNNATYSEAGYLYLAPGAYIDATMTAIDRANDDCVSDVTGDKNLSNSLVGGKYGCDFQNTANVTLGRFIPDHFAVTGAALNNRSAAACAPASTFTYMGETMSVGFTLEARNVADGITQNYAGAFARLDPLAAANLNLGAVDDSTPRTPFPVCGASPVSPCFTLGTLAGTAFANGAATIIALPATVYRGGTPVAPFSKFQLGIAPSDADGVTTAKDLDAGTAAGVSLTKVGAATILRYGRLKIDNAYGSDLLDLPVRVAAQYWNGTVFVDNVLDSCTALPVASFQLINPSGNIGGKVGLTTANMGHIQDPAPVLRFGAGHVLLTHPTSALQVRGSVTLRSLLPFLPGEGRESFGISRSGPLIFTREVY